MSLIWHDIAWPVVVIALLLFAGAWRAGLFSVDPEDWMYR